MELTTSANIVSLPEKAGNRRSAILRLVRNHVDEKTDFLINGLKENIADALFEEMSGMEEQASMSHHFNIMRAMKVEEAAWRESFDEMMAGVWAGFQEASALRLPGMPSGEIGELMKRLSDRTTNHYKVLINDTRYRFQTLLQREVEQHPLYPEVYYRVFWESLRSTALDWDERCLVVPLFHRFVMDRYGQILLTANRTLIEFKVDTTIQISTSSQ